MTKSNLHNWQTKKLGEVIKLEYGKPLPDFKRKSDGAYPVYGANGEKDRTDEYYHNKQSIIVGRKGSAGEINLTEKRFWPLDVTYFVTFDEKKYDLKFLHNTLLTLELPKLAKGVKPGINRNEVYAIEVRIPPLPDQKRIVAILDEAFAAIATAKENAEKNLQNARELFESYLQSVFANPGDGWEEKKLGEVCEFDKTPNSKSLPYIGLEHIESNSGKFIGSTTPKKVKSSTFYFTDEHVLYGRLRPYLNKVLLPSFEGHCSTEIFPIMPKNILYKGYLFYWLISGETVKRINATWTGARMPRANMNAVLGFEIPLPPLPEQRAVVSKLDALSAETKKLEALYRHKLNDLDELKKSVLQKAFNGELTGTAS